MSIHVENKCITLRMIAHSSMVHAQVLEAYIHFALIFYGRSYITVATNKFYVNNKHNIIYLYNAIFDESFSFDLAYTSKPYSETMAIRPALLYIKYAIYSKGKNWRYNHVQKL